jgi:hypothetical protein
MIPGCPFARLEPEEKPLMMDPELLLGQLNEQFNLSGDGYARLNAVRNWVNANCPGFELYLEDVWNEKVAGETHFEYILRSKKTYNETDVIGYDIYKNHQDASGVWHLDDYVETHILMPDLTPLVTFIQAN